ncbi:MAG: uroporphyrinogen-III C-methyltransferase, partial [bacterium]
MTGRVVLIGAGPGDPGLLTIRGRDLLSRCDVVIYDALVSDTLLSIAPQNARCIYVGKRARSHARPQPEINEMLVQEAKAGHFVVRLKGGDPFLFGRGGEEALYLAEHGIPFEIVPGVSALTAVPACAGIPVTERDLSSCLIAVTGHEDPSKSESALDWSRIAKVPGTLILFMGIHNLPVIVKDLLEAGRSPETPAAVIRYGTLPEQHTLLGTLADINDRVEKAGLRPPALVIIGEVVGLRDRLNWFETRPLFGRTVVVTRPRKQAERIYTMLTDLGASVLAAPMIRTVSPTDSAPLRKAVRELDRYDWIVFSSTNGVDGFFKVLAEEGGDARWLAPCRIAAVGPATEESLLARTVVPDLMPSQFSSDGLAEALSGTDSISGRRILHPCSSIAPENLADNLRSLGATVERVEAYSIVPEDDCNLDWDPIPDAITFASPSAATYFMDRVAPEHLEELKAKTVFASIGPATTARMIELDLPVQIQASEHTAAGLVEA